MSNWTWEEENDSYLEDLGFDTVLAASAAAGFQHTSGAYVTTKIPPSYNGQTLWFTYEDMVEDWSDLTELHNDKRGPALKSRLEGPAATYKHYLDRTKLKEDNGVEYFLNTLRPFFVKGTNSVFLWRFMQIFRFHPDSKICNSGLERSSSFIRR